MRVVSLGAQLAVADGPGTVLILDAASRELKAERCHEKLSDPVYLHISSYTFITYIYILLLSACCEELCAFPRFMSELSCRSMVESAQAEITAHARWLSAAVSREETSVHISPESSTL